jgi:hypothetical protein
VTKHDASWNATNIPTSVSRLLGLVVEHAGHAFLQTNASFDRAFFTVTWCYQPLNPMTLLKVINRQCGNAALKGTVL